MLRIGFFGSALMLGALGLIRSMPNHSFVGDGSLSKAPRLAGNRYPHSSARQQARYRRQIAAGQLQMERA